MRTKFILVDYDNVHTIDPKTLLGADVRVIVFLGEKLASVKTDLVLQIQSLAERGCFYRITGTGKNAMDLHIAFKVGHLTSEYPDASFHILSKDGDFVPIVEHLKGQKIEASSGAKVATVPPKPKAKKPTPQTALDRANAVKVSLGKPKATKPGTREKLANHVNTLAGATLTKKDIEGIVDLLLKDNFIAVDGDKVTYPGLVAK